MFTNNVKSYFHFLICLIFTYAFIFFLSENSLDYSNGYSFYTYDRDYGDCAKTNKGAFWFQSGVCYISNLNGKYNGTGQTGIIWNTFKPYYSLKSSIMMIRRR